MRKLAIFIGISLLLLVGILLIAPNFIPTEIYKQQIIEKVEANTGRQMAINGEVSMRFLPRLQIAMEDVELGNPQGFTPTGNEPMMNLRRLQVSLSLWDLLQKEAVLDRFELIDPVIRLARDADGTPNWEFTPVEAAASAGDSEASSPKDALKGDIRLPHLEIRNGTISYRETPAAEPLSLSKLNVTIHLPSLHDTLSLKAETLWNGTLPLKLEASVTSPDAWMQQRNTNYALTLTGDGDTMKLTSKGTAINKDNAPVIQGDMQLQVSSLKELGTALSMTLLPEAMPGKGKLDMRGSFAYQEPKLSLQGLAIVLDSLSLGGSADVVMQGTRPAIHAALSSPDVVVMDNFMPQDTPTVKPPQDNAPVSGVNATGWSTEPLMADMSFLQDFDADIALTLGGLKAKKIIFGALSLQAKLAKGALAVDVPQFAFYGGKANASARLNVTGARSLSLSKKATIRNADIGQFLSDAYSFDRLAGKGDVILDIQTSGISAHDFVNHANGSGNFMLRNGAIRGFNLAEVVRDARTVVQNVKNKDFTADMRSQAPADGVKTDFAELSGSFRLTEGTLANNDLVLKAPLLNMTGAGTVNIPLKTVDYRLKPTVVGSIEGEGRDENHAGLTIPIRVTGTFDTLKFNPDAGAVVQDLIADPKGTVENLEENFKGLKGDVKSLFKGL